MSQSAMCQRCEKDVSLSHTHTDLHPVIDRICMYRMRTDVDLKTLKKRGKRQIRKNT